ncbi:hypothetical protein PPERSA_09846 [Pseudocohnilembus persalinus]|uniref:Uncharacterized protein n=1 Tax=Pseudocohnilembus persalinus TaxID=266149 RepID=A0A0V0QUJ2_PSEPJ|nr:hypothetical protein PPERSA_09846 [Pseudocohnilembus persalinus]|eukprot:KRX05706.1 hypothetical protein PPERSA_09846 [Pseudocohnilembus persalinus]
MKKSHKKQLNLKQQKQEIERLQAMLYPKEKLFKNNYNLDSSSSSSQTYYCEQSPESDSGYEGQQEEDDENFYGSKNQLQQLMRENNSNFKFNQQNLPRYINNENDFNSYIKQQIQSQQRQNILNQFGSNFKEQTLNKFYNQKENEILVQDFQEMKCQQDKLQQQLIDQQKSYQELEIKMQQQQEEQKKKQLQNYQGENRMQSQNKILREVKLDNFCYSSNQKQVNEEDNQQNQKQKNKNLHFFQLPIIQQFSSQKDADNLKQFFDQENFNQQAESTNQLHSDTKQIQQQIKELQDKQDKYNQKLKQVESQQNQQSLEYSQTSIDQQSRFQEQLKSLQMQQQLNQIQQKIKQQELQNFETFQTQCQTSQFSDFNNNNFNYINKEFQSAQKNHNQSFIQAQDSQAVNQILDNFQNLKDKLGSIQEKITDITEKKENYVNSQKFYEKIRQQMKGLDGIFQEFLIKLGDIMTSHQQLIHRQQEQSQQIMQENQFKNNNELLGYLEEQTPIKEMKKLLGELIEKDDRNLESQKKSVDQEFIEFEQEFNKKINSNKKYVQPQKDSNINILDFFNRINNQVLDKQMKSLKVRI